MHSPCCKKRYHPLAHRDISLPRGSLSERSGIDAAAVAERPEGMALN